MRNFTEGLRGASRNHRRRRLLALTTAATLAPALVVPAAASARTHLIGSGSSGAQPYMQQLFSAYHKLHPSVYFTYNPDGGNQGVKDVQKGVSQFAIQTALNVVAGTAFAPLFNDALCVDVNSSNTISSISFTQLQNIFAGNLLSWNQVGGNLSTTIDPQGRNSAAGEYTYFTATVMGGGTVRYASNVTQEPTDGLVAQNIVNDKSAIGYVGLANSHRKGLKTLSVSNGGAAYACTTANIRNNRYPLVHYDYGVLPYSGASKAVLAFFNWITDTKAGASAVAKAGAVATVKHPYGASF